MIRPEPEKRRLGSRPPILFVHGIYDDGRIFGKMAGAMQAQGWPTQAISLVPNDGRAPLEALAAQLAHFVNHRLPPNQPFILIAHSMGGLVSRYYLQRLGGLERVSRFISIASPHHGSLWAYFSNRPALKQMRPNSPFLAGLNADAHTLAQVNHLSIWTPFDLTIIPPTSSILPGSQHQSIPALCHPCLLSDPRCLELIKRLCAACVRN